jgi:hypothetical protein
MLSPFCVWYVNIQWKEKECLSYQISANDRNEKGFCLAVNINIDNFFFISFKEEKKSFYSSFFSFTHENQ